MNVAALLHTAPGPVTSATLLVAGNSQPTKPTRALTNPPLLTTNRFIAPLVPTHRLLATSQREPASLTRTLLKLAPTSWPIRPSPPVNTAPPALISNWLPRPNVPICRLALLHTEPAPVTSAELLLPEP